MVNLDLRQKLIEKVRELEQVCYRYQSPDISPFPSKPNNDDGDMTLFNGLLASTGYLPSLDAVYQSQGQSGAFDGMFFRSPYRRLTENKGHPAYFSGDMALGVLLVLSSRYGSEYQKTAAARKWMTWINANRECKVKKPWGGGCLVRGLYRYAPDDRSLINPNMWALMGRVWSANNWDKHSQMKTFEGSDGDYVILEAQQTPLGYRLHLKAIQSYIKLILNQSREYQEKLAKICYSRAPSNLFFKYLATKDVTDSDVQLFLNWAPSKEAAIKGHCWTWEQEDIENGILNSCGWDFVFLGRLYLKHIGVFY